MEWLAVGLPHNSSRLFPRLPFLDAVQLAALVGTGRMSWAEVNAALDARIKQALASQRGRPDEPDEAGEQARQMAEDEIWAHYHAMCDAVFADDTAAPADPWSREQLRERERVLNRLRSERDRALAALDRRKGPLPRASSAMQPEPAAGARMHISAAERDALDKLDATGFAGSQLMADAICRLAMPLAGAMRGLFERAARIGDIWVDPQQSNKHNPVYQTDVQ